MKVSELQEILNKIPDDAIVTVNNDGFSLYVTSNYNKRSDKVMYYGLFIGMKGSPLIWTEIGKEI